MTALRSAFPLLAFLALTGPAFSETTPANPAAPAKSAKAKAPKREPLPTDLPDTLKAELNLTYGKTPEQELKLDVYRPKDGGDSLPACILVHGGGWTGGDKERFTPLAIALAQKGYVVANIEYRLAGVAKYPAGVQDCFLAVRFVRANAKRFGLDPNRIGCWGGSAGGHLVGLMAGAATDEKFLTSDLKDVSSAVQATSIMAGPTDLTMPTFVEALRRAKEKSNSYLWLGKLYDDAPDLYREASPITHFTKTTGPVLFITGSLDNPDRDTAGLEKLKSLGVPTKQIIFPDAKHGCWLQRPTFEQCVDATGAWFKEHMPAR
jgi:acetyl esterase/lipase